MKRILTGILAILYLCISTGMTLHQHYCMGEFIGTSLWHTDEGDVHPCDSCGMEKESSDNGCCKEEHTTLKLEQKHVPGSDVAVPLFAGFIALPAVPQTWAAPQQLTVRSGHYTAMSNGPPALLSRACPIYLRVRSFRV